MSGDQQNENTSFDNKRKSLRLPPASGPGQHGLVGVVCRSGPVPWRYERTVCFGSRQARRRGPGWRLGWRASAIAGNWRARGRSRGARSGRRSRSRGRCAWCRSTRGGRQARGRSAHPEWVSLPASEPGRAERASLLGWALVRRVPGHCRTVMSTPFRRVGRGSITRHLWYAYVNGVYYRPVYYQGATVYVVTP